MARGGLSSAVFKPLSGSPMSLDSQLRECVGVFMSCQSELSIKLALSCDWDYTVSQKTVQNCFCHNFVKFQPILI